MWTPCPQVLDAPVKIWLFELEDWLCIVGSLIVAALWFDDTSPCMAISAAVGLTLYVAKRGRPPGFVLHWLHGMELVRLPGILGPRVKRYSPW